MLCTRHFCCRIFHANNKPGSRIFTNWRNSPIIFANQFMQFQQKRNAPILFKPQQHQYKRYQFCSKNDGNENHLPSIESHLNLDWQFLWLDAYNRKSVKLEIIEGKSGQKFFCIILYKLGKFNNFNKIPVPKDAYAFVRAFDELILELAKENFEQKLLQIQDPKSIIETAKDDRRTIRPLKLKTVELTGIIHKFQVELVLFVNKDRGMMDEICLELTSFNEKTNQRRRSTLPLRALPWLRTQMAEMLVKHDGTEEIGKEAPAQIPQKFLHMGVSHASPAVPNNITSVQKLQQRGNRPQLGGANKPVTFPKITNKMRNSNQSCYRRQKMFRSFPFQQKPNLKQLDVKKPIKCGNEKLNRGITKGSRGHKFFHISTIKFGKFHHFSKIPVPEDAYAFVRVLDELIEELAAENFEQKLDIQIKDPQSAIEIANDGHKTSKQFKLKTVELTGIIDKFQLELLLFLNTHNEKIYKKICLGLCAVSKTSARKTIMNLPLQTLPWLRIQMAEILTKHDGTEKIEREAPAQIPKQLLHLNSTPTFRNGIYSAGQHKGISPQISNIKPTSIQHHPKMPAKMLNSNQSGYKNQRMPKAVQQKSNLKQSKMINKNNTEPMDPKIALERGIQTLFDFDDEEMENYRRIAAKIKKSIKTLNFYKK